MANRGRDRCDSKGIRVAGVLVDRSGPLTAYAAKIQEGKRFWVPVHHPGALRDFEDPVQVAVTFGAPPPASGLPLSISGSDWFSALENPDSCRGRDAREQLSHIQQNPNNNPLAFVAHMWTKGSGIRYKTWWGDEVFRAAGRYSLAVHAEKEASEITKPMLSLLEKAQTLAQDPNNVALLPTDSARDRENFDRLLAEVFCGHTPEEAFMDREETQGFDRWGNPATVTIKTPKEHLYPESLEPLLETVIKTARALDIAVSTQELENIELDFLLGADGYAVRQHKGVRLNKKLNGKPRRQTAVLLHELGHIFDPAPLFMENRGALEVVAETTAMTLINILTGTENPHPGSLWYVANWGFWQAAAEKNGRYPEGMVQDLEERVAANVGLLLGVLRGDEVAIGFARTLAERNRFPEHNTPPQPDS